MQLKRINDHKDFKGNLWWGIDSVPPEELFKIIGRADFPNGICGIKISRTMIEGELYADLGWNLIRRIQEDYGVAVFDDAKFAEIPSNVLSMAKFHLTRYRPFMVNVMENSCSTALYPEHPKMTDEDKYDLMYDFAQLCSEYGAKSCAVSILTSKTPQAVEYEYNGGTTESVVRRYADLAKNCGITDFVCSPAEIDFVKDYGLIMNTPGIRKEGDSADDQARIDTPYGAMMKADFININGYGDEPGLNVRLVTNRSVWQKEQPIEKAIENIHLIAEDIEKAATHLRLDKEAQRA